MTEKRFTLRKPKVDNDIGCSEIADNGEWISYGEIVELLNNLSEENEQLKQLIKELEKQIHLIHMSSMFSTVKSFKGDVSKRYEYSEKTDTIYDTANTYGQYNKVLGKKEIVMLLNEYETLLESDLND